MSFNIRERRTSFDKIPYSTFSTTIENSINSDIPHIGNFTRGFYFR